MTETYPIWRHSYIMNITKLSKYIESYGLGIPYCTDYVWYDTSSVQPFLHASIIIRVLNYKSCLQYHIDNLTNGEQIYRNVILCYRTLLPLVTTLHLMDSCHRRQVWQFFQSQPILVLFLKHQQIS